MLDFSLKLGDMMSEKRSLERIRCYYYLKVFDRDSGIDIGSIFDITVRGMKIISDNPFEKGQTRCFRIYIPEGSMHGEHFDLEAEVKWCKKNDKEDYFEAGFKFCDVDKKYKVFLKNLISDFRQMDLL